MPVLYLAVGLPLALFAAGIGPFICQAYWGKRGALIGWGITLYLWVGLLVVSGRSGGAGPRGFGQLWRILFWWD